MVRKSLRQTDEQVEMSPEKSYELDSWTLCGARHTISAGTTYKPNGLIPFDDYIVVYFKPEDTGGGGHVENALAAVAGYVMDVGKGAYTAFADPKDYSDTTKTGQEIVEQNYEDCIEREGTRWNCKGELVEAGTYTALNYTVGSTVRGLGNVASGRWPWDGGAETDLSLTAYRAESPFYSPNGQKPALTFGLEDASVDCGWDMPLGIPSWSELTGGCYHGVNGATHKVRITIKNTFEGKTTTPYIFDLAGCGATYDEDDEYCPEGEAIKRFLINRPGTWTVTVEPLATATCNALDYTYDYSFDVATPEDWTPPAIQTLTDGMSEALQEVGLPISVTPLGFVIGASLVGGILLRKIWKNKQARKKEE